VTHGISRKNFCGWTTEARDKKVADLYKVIEDHVLYGINVIVPRELYFSYSRQVSPGKINDPYFLAAYYMMMRIAEVQNIAGLNEPVDFIFDRQDEHETFMRDAWDFLKEFSADGIRRRLRKRPLFEKDTEFMPLQAADLHAWWVRKRYQNQEKGEPPVAFMWEETRDLRSIPI
jgi:hypothetical protein